MARRMILCHARLASQHAAHAPRPSKAFRSGIQQLDKRFYHSTGRIQHGQNIQPSKEAKKAGESVESPEPTLSPNVVAKKSILDWIQMQPSLRLAALLKDILPSTKGPNDDGPPEKHQFRLALPDYLVYWPLQAAPSQLAPDGADNDHVPKGYSVAGPNDPPRQGVRLWKSGQVYFPHNWRWFFGLRQTTGVKCVEVTYNNPSVRGGMNSNVDIARAYVSRVNEREYSPVLLEKRTLAFVKDAVAERIILSASADVVPGPEVEPIGADYVHNFTTTPAQLFQFSALSYNAHYIHLDPKNALVHGPLLKSLMLRVAQQHIEMESEGTQAISKFKYHCLRPLKVGAEARVCLARDATEDGWTVWVERLDGRLIAKGRIATCEAAKGREDGMDINRDLKLEDMLDRAAMEEFGIEPKDLEDDLKDW